MRCLLVLAPITIDRYGALRSDAIAPLGINATAVPDG